MLAVSGKDFQNRDLIIIYNFKEVIKYKKVELLARQLSDFDIKHLSFHVGNATSIVSCGKENIRFYKLKN